MRSSSDGRNRSVHFGNIYEAYLFNTVVFTNSMMFRRSLLEKTGLQRKAFGMFHDLEFALRVCRHAKVAFVDVPTYKLRYHPGQISTTKKPHGGKVAIKIQRDLLRVTKHHLRLDPEFCYGNRDRIHRHLARLCRAVAIPMLSYDQGTAHESVHYPLRARRYLSKCREYGHGEPILYALTFSPRLVRRAIIQTDEHVSRTDHPRGWIVIAVAALKWVAMQIQRFSA